MRVLIIKLTSMGDLMHVLPAITDATKHFPDITFDWVVDKAFAAVPKWHPNVDRVIPTQHRIWRKGWMKSLLSGELKDFYQTLNQADYDVVIDMQNNIKSAIVSLLRRGQIHGVDKASSREKPAYLAYHYRHAVDPQQHAVTRMRQLMALSLGYPMPTTVADAGVNLDHCHWPESNIPTPTRYVMLVHNASWLTKLWPMTHWQGLTLKLAKAGYSVMIPCGNDEEFQRAKQIASVTDQAFALPRLPLDNVVAIMQGATAVVGSDTGLAHMAAMMGKPAITLYGATDPTLIGTEGPNQTHLISEYACAPCYKRTCPLAEAQHGHPVCMQAMDVEQVWHRLEPLLQAK
jgi:heptosyltransferase-1